MCWMVGKIQWRCHHPCSFRFCTEPPSPWEKGENHPSEDHHCLLTSLSCLYYFWTTRRGPLLAATQDLAFVPHQRMLFRSFWIVLCLFPNLIYFSPGVFGAGPAIRPGPLQRADALELFLQLLAMDDEDAAGLDCGEAGKDKTRGKEQ